MSANREKLSQVEQAGPPLFGPMRAVDEVHSAASARNVELRHGRDIR
jgi:hypothetical protein